MTQLILSGVNYRSEAFARVLSGAFSHRLSLFNSMLAVASDQMIAPVAGDYASVAQWDALSGHADKISTSLTTTINAPSQFKHRWPWVEREKAWGADEIILTIAGKEHDATKAIAEMAAEYWAGEIHYDAINVANGAFASALAATHVKDDSGSSITKEGIIAAKKLLGDNSDKLSAIVMNSSVYADALTSNMISNYTALGDSVVLQGTIPKMLGMTPYQTDLLTATAGVYPTLLGLAGSMIYKTRPRPNATYNNTNRFRIGNLDIVLYRNSTSNGGYDALISRLSYCVGIPGVQYDDTGGVNPTSTVLATSTSYTKVQTDDKLIPLVMYKSN